MDEADSEENAEPDLRDLERLFFEGTSSSGDYTPEGIRLHPRGDDRLEHDVLYLHEVHHRALNDDTAWGTALRIAHEHPAWRAELFPDLLRACAQIHEAFATYLAVHLAQAVFSDAERVLDAFPRYRRPYEAMRVIAASASGAHQRDLLATAVARVCMQSPIISLLDREVPRVPRLAEVPLLDRPDARFAVLRRQPRGWWKRLAQQADVATQDAFGIDPAAYDDRLTGATDIELDELWTAWEDHVAIGLRAHLEAVGATVVGRRDHQDAARDLIARLNQDDVVVALTVTAETGPSTDLQEAAAMTRAAAVSLGADGEPWLAGTARLGSDISLEQLLDLVDATTRVEGVPQLVIHGRRVERVTEAYRWRTDPLQDDADEGVVFAVRVVLDHEDEDADDPKWLLQVALPSPSALDALLTAWDDRGAAAVCIAASCFVSSSWQSRWLSGLHRLPIVVLQDIGIEQVTSGGTRALLPLSAEISAGYVNTGHRGLSGFRWHVDGQAHITLFIGVPLGVNLIAAQLEALFGERLTTHDIDWSPWDSPFTAVLRSLAYTESSLGIDEPRVR